MKSHAWLSLLLMFCWPGFSPAQTTKPAGYAKWPNGPSTSPNYFPIGVWLQNPNSVSAYKKIGINVLVGLYDGNQGQYLTMLEKAQMPVICAQNDFLLQNRNRKIIVGWLQQDEPDNAQQLPGGHGYGPPVDPQALAKRYEQMREADPTRPVYLNFGQGVAWNGWVGRGSHTNKPEDYREYVPSGDILAFDIYPAVATHPDVAGKLWLVPYGVDRLRQWSKDKKIIWNAIETTQISNPNVKPTPLQVKAEVWMSIIHGSRGILYFAHQFKPKFVEAGLLADKEMSLAVSRINAQITDLAPVLNTPTIKDGATVKSSAEVPVDLMVKQHGGASYVMAVAMRDGSTRATFEISKMKNSATVSVLGEDRKLTAQDGRWEDTFDGFAVHLYRIDTKP